MEDARKQLQALARYSRAIVSAKKGYKHEHVLRTGEIEVRRLSRRYWTVNGMWLKLDAAVKRVEAGV